ncbi:AT-rich interactive domain-containing protein 1B [Acipenser ruthenus]|uniref:AT-rich interactive domain-containing protein 1B n=1 Tax=Acipenser ruthenus TaxID=7906 RepID=A0A662YK46_ACIRT|nr:AT-rich interactive domain-containing protein 1B [Acipenser ruthenus]
METGLIANHTQKHVGVGDPPPPAHRHIPAPPPQQQQQQFNQFQQHRPHQFQNSSSQTQAQAEPENKQHRGKDNILGSQVAQQQQMLNKSEEEAEELPCKPADQMGSKYEQASLGPPNNNTNNQQSSAGSSAASECHRYYGNARGGPRFDQHGGQQSPGMGVMHPSAPSSMYSSQNSHEAYQNSQYNHYPNYRPGYGTMSSPRQGNSMGPGSNTITAAAGSHHGKATAMAAAAHSNVGGFHRFPGQSQHPSGATPTLNQLLTAPSAMMRGYGTSYPDYSSPSTPLHHQQQQQPPSLAVGMGRDMRSQYESATQGWALQQRTHPAMRPGNSMSRAQVNAFIQRYFCCCAPLPV